MCDVDDGLELRIVAPNAAFATGAWLFELEMLAPEPGTASVECEVRKGSPGQLICARPEGTRAPYRVTIDAAERDALTLLVTRDGVAPLADEGTDPGVSGPSKLRVAVTHGDMPPWSTEIEPRYIAEEFVSGPLTCLVCLSAQHEIALP